MFPGPCQCKLLGRRLLSAAGGYTRDNAYGEDVLDEDGAHLAGGVGCLLVADLDGGVVDELSLKNAVKRLGLRGWFLRRF